LLRPTDILTFLLNVPSIQDADEVGVAIEAYLRRLYVSVRLLADQQQQTSSWAREHVVGMFESLHSSGLQLQSAQRMMP